MKKIKCPNCGEEIKLNQSSYDIILSQIRTIEYNQQIEDIRKLCEKEKNTAIEESRLRTENAAQRKISELNSQLREIHRKKEEDREHFRECLKEKEDEITNLKNFRAKQSTKMIGESLELHCEAEFNRLRSAGFPNAYFEKDNDAKSGSKGDYIYREYDDTGIEILSIMFEMKNECDTTTTKKKNEDFFKELDKDRRLKRCEYAVLVSMLEFDNEFYNAGIADVSYRYPKMYVVRPQCFITIISILRSAALNTLSYKKELSLIKSRNIDMAIFESEMEDFKSRFGRNFQLASDKFSKAIDEIDKTIALLQKTKEDLLSSENNLRLANEKAQALTIEKLEAMTCVCSVGLDMIAIPGSTSASTISGIIADEAAIGMINQKTTAVRIIPVEGKDVGDTVEFGGLLGYAPVMPVNQYSCEAFVSRMGRIPAPIHSFKN